MTNSLDENRRKMAGVRWCWTAANDPPTDLAFTLIPRSDGFCIGDGQSIYARTWQLHRAPSGMVLTVWGDMGGPTFHAAWNGSRFVGVWDDRKCEVQILPHDPVELLDGADASVGTIRPVPFYVGIPTLRCYDLCKLAVDSVLASRVFPEAIFVVDNGTKIAEFRHPHPLVSVIRPNRNLGVARSWNLLHKLATPHPLVILNDDIALGRNCLEKLITTDAPFVALSEFRAYEAFLIREEIWKKVGEFDEAFFPAYHEDNDHHRRMALAGYSIACPPSDGITQHGPSATVDRLTPDELREFHRQFDAGRAYYLAKWGGLPHQETYLTPFNR